MHKFPSTERDGKFLSRYLLMIVTLLLSSVFYVGKSVTFWVSFGFDDNS